MSEFDPSMRPGERESLIALGERLTASRPVPAAAFRGDLRRLIVSARPAPRGLRLRIATCLVSGTALLLVAVLGLQGSGPLAPEPGAGQQQASVDVIR